MRTTQDTAISTAVLRSVLAALRARYDSSAVSDAVYGLIKQLESELAWREHRREVRP